MKALIAISILLTSALAEPPVDNRYLPPNHDFNGGGVVQPSEEYGAPGFGTQAGAGLVARRPSSNYGLPLNARRPSNQYGPPGTRNGPSNQYIPPSDQYGPPSTRNGPSNQYIAPVRQPSNQYGPPKSQSLGRPAGSFGQRPRTGYGPPSPSTEYGAPNLGFGGNQQYSQNGGLNNLDQSRRYLPPGGGRSYNGDEENGEPANYNFEYTVKDEPSGNDFGHRESRMGDRAEGIYYVVLPDGRKQTVAYEADQNGYRPKISYEDVGAAGGFNRGVNNRYQGYQEGY